MIKIISKISTSGYKKIVKPILFLFPADGVHINLIRTGVIIGNIAPLRWFMKQAWSYKNPSKLSQIYKGIYFANPIGLSAGFDKNFQLLKVFEPLGFGFAECGSMSYGASDGNPRPHYHRLPKSKSLVVNAGLNNLGSKILVKRIKKWQLKHKKTYPLNISVVKTNSPVSSTDKKGSDEYIRCLKEIKKAGIGDVITINISCPNAYGGEPFTTPKRLELLLKKVDKLNLKQPLLLKMPSDKAWPEFKALLDVALKHGISGFTISNLQKNRELITEDHLDASIKGNLSGKPVFNISNDLISETYKYCGDRAVISGVGGVFNAEDAYEKIKRGATFVQLITGMIFEGPSLIGQINSGLVELMQKDGYTHISQAVGSYHK